MTAYILKGDPKEVDKVLRENRIRISRGVISITPAEPDAAHDEDSVKTLIENHSAPGEDRKLLIAGQNRLAELTGIVVSIAVEGGQAIPEDVAASLGEFGIVVPKIAENVPESTENVANDGENVPETVPNNPEPVDDSKNVEVEDMTEVNLDDVKDAPEVDTKDVPAPTPKKTRTKKSE